MGYSIILRNIKNIKELKFLFPQKKGVYVLTGANGCGKTSLLTALARLGDSTAFVQYKTNTIDKHKDASVEYITPTESVKYVHGEQRWTPKPKKNVRILSSFPFTNTCFVNTSTNRFFSQDQLEAKRPRYIKASDYIKNAMNDIMGTTKFSDLSYITIKAIRGRKKRLCRSDKLYLIKNNNLVYSEQNFSLGERLLLNTLDILENVQVGTLLLIDEVELSLHPIAQVKFYDMLKKEAKDKNLCVIISTHSSTLIKYADNRIYLESKGKGVINVLNDCYPTYILRTISVDYDYISDFIFFVEDDMAKEYFKAILLIYMNETQKYISPVILPIGGYIQVINFENQVTILGINKKKTQVFLDADVKDTIDVLRKKRVQTDKEKELLTTFDNNKNYISFLPITPELGVWQWIEQNIEILKDAFDKKYGVQNYSIELIIDKVSKEESVHFPKEGDDDIGKKKREWAKGCFKNFIEKVCNKNMQLTEREIVQIMMQTYAMQTININDLKSLFGSLFSRK